MSNIKRKFIESHWLTFAIKGAISVVAGFCLMFTRNDDVHLLTQILGWTMFGLAFIEIANVVYRKVRSHNWGFPLFLGALELAISIALLFTIDPNATDESLIPTRDRFMWVVNGMVGAVLAVLMFGGASAANDTTAAYFGAKVLLFGTYLMVNGITDLFFGIHSRDEMAELHSGSHEKATKKGKK